MGINVNAKTDYSALFSSLNTNSNNNVSDLTSLLSDYSSIKSGTYGKLMKAYYATDEGKASAKTTQSKLSNSYDEAEETKKAYNTIASNADAVTKSVSEISGLKSDASEDDIYNAVNGYVKSYNSLLDSSDKVTNSTIDTRINTITNSTKVNESALKKLGITVGENGKLSLNKETLSEASRDDISNAFATRGSYGYGVSVTAGMAASNANYEATKTSLYTNSGSYNVSTGTMMDSLF